MKILVSVLAVLPIIYAIGDVNSDLLGQEFQDAVNDHVRVERQVLGHRGHSQPPPQIQQLLQAQNYRAPLVPVPQQPIPKLSPAQPQQPQQVPQTQVSQYRPQVQFASGVQQPDYRGFPANGGQYKKPIIPQPPQYRPLPQQPQYRPQPQQPQYRPQPQPNYNAQPQPQYSSKLPPHIQQLLQYQSSLGNAIPKKA